MISLRKHVDDWPGPVVVAGGAVSLGPRIEGAPHHIYM